MMKGGTVAQSKPAVSPWKYTKLCWVLLGVVVVLNLCMAYKNAPHQNMHHMGDGVFFAFQLTVVLPLAAVWLIALRGALRLKKYATVIGATPDGNGVDAIANALLWLVGYVVVLPLLRNLTYLFTGSSVERPAVMVANHVPIIFMLLAVFNLYRGAHQLDAIVSAKLWTTRRLALLAIGLSVLGALFLVYFSVMVPQLGSDNGVPRFAAPMPWILFSYALPQVLIWIVGCLACFSLAHYSLQTPGRIYKRAFQRLYIGLIVAIGCIFVSQLLTISTVNLSMVSIGVSLIYMVLVLATGGFWLIARGADSLLKIEQVG